MHDLSWNRGAWIAEFADDGGLRRAVKAMRRTSPGRIEYFAPHVVDDIPAPDPRPSRLPLAALVGGVTGAVLGYAIQWYTNVVAYPLDIGGRPLHAAPVFLIATFEGAILGAGLAAFIGFLVSVRLPRLWHPLFDVDAFERASDDRYWLAIEDDRQAPPDELRDRLLALGAIQVRRVEDA